MRIRALAVPAVVLGMVVACGGGEDRSFAGTGGAAGSSGTGGSSATGGSSGTGASGGTSGTGGVAGSGTGGSAAAGGSAGAGGATGGTGGATGGTGGSTGGTGGSTGGTGGSTGGTGGSTGGTGGAVACDTTTHLCAPDAPPAWTGPIAFHHGANAPPACPGAYPTKGTDAHTGLTPGAASCACSCDPATGITGCNGTATIHDIANTIPACATNPGGTPVVWSAAAGSCTKATGNSVGQVTLTVPSPSSQGTCAPKSNNTLPTPTWAEQTRSCSGGVAAAGTCNTGSTCMPKAFVPYELCIYRPGNAQCPSAGYTKKALVYDSFQDGRTCSACSCGNASSGCKGAVNMVSSCSGTPILFSSVSGCTTPQTDISTIQYGTYTPAPSGTCPASTPALSGVVTTGGEATVCCLP